MQFSSGGNGTLKNSNFTNNNATYEDGAVCFLNDGEVTDCNFINNTARIDGGAIEIDGTGTLENCNFTNNAATEGNGGAIWTFFANIKNCNFALNTAKNGGAIRFYSNRNVTDCSFINNTAFDGDGGAILMSYGNVSNCDFVDNVASDGDGGAIWMSYANVSNCYFAQNTALDGDGGAIFSKQRCSTVDACIFKTSSDTININTPVLPPTLDVDNFTTFSNSGEKLTFDLKTSSGMPIDNGNITISLYYEDDDGWLGNYSCLSGEGWAVDLPVGSYYALFNTEYVGFEPVNRTIRIIEKTNILCSDISVTYDEEAI